MYNRSTSDIFRNKPPRSVVFLDVHSECLCDYDVELRNYQRGSDWKCWKKQQKKREAELWRKLSRVVLIILFVIIVYIIVFFIMYWNITKDPYALAEACAITLFVFLFCWFLFFVSIKRRFLWVHCRFYFCWFYLYVSFKLSNPSKHMCVLQEAWLSVYFN